VTIRGLIVPLAAIAVFSFGAEVYAQGAFPAPLPSGSLQPAPSASPFPPVNGEPARPQQSSPFPPVNNQQANAPAASPFPPVNGAGNPSVFSNGAAPMSGGFTPARPRPQQQAGGDKCMENFVPLRQEAERRGNMIKKASDRGAPPSEACKLIGNYAQAEVAMIKYVDKNAAECGIPADIAKQLKDSHKNTLQLRSKVCSAAAQMQQQQRGPAGPSLSDVLGSAPAPTSSARSNSKYGSTFDTLSGNALQR